MQATTSRSTLKTEVDVIDVDGIAPLVLDVDKLHTKYECTEEDGIEAIDPNTFRQSFRKNKGKGKEAIKRQSSAPGFTTSLNARVTPDHNANGDRNFPSTLGPVIQDIRAQKRPNPSSFTAPATDPSYLSKRRKLDHSPPTSSSPSPLPSSSKAISAPVARLRRVDNAPSPSSVQVKTASSSSPNISLAPTVPNGRGANSTFPSPRPGSGTTTVQTISRNTSRKRVLDIIELSSDSESDIVQVLSPRKKKQRRSEESSGFDFPPFSSPDVEMSEPPVPPPEPESDSDDDWNWDPPGFDLNDSSRWKSIEVNKNKLEDDVAEDFENLTIDESSLRTPPRRSQPNTSRKYPSPPRTLSSSKYIWGQLWLASNLHFRPRARPQLMNASYIRPWHLEFRDLHLQKLKAVNSFKEAPGSITKIEQKGQWTAIASACDGGLPDLPDERPSDYNRPGSLMTWCKGLDIPKGHEAKRDNYRNGMKYYAVHDVKFDPNRTAFVTSGADKRVRVWGLSDQTNEDEVSVSDGTNRADSRKSQWTSRMLHRFNKPPHDLAFKPQTSLLAVAERKVHLFKFTATGSERTELPFHLKDPHIAGATMWGLENTAEHLFVSSEPSNPDILSEETFKGWHQALDVGSLRPLYELDAHEAGDTLTIDPTGAVLALSTRASVNRHILRLYDVKRRKPEAHTRIDLESFPTRYRGFEGEVNCATFSPDGIYLALARNDNVLHVYDSRMLTRGPLTEYEHFGESKASSKTVTFGVVKAQWIQSEHTSRIALVTAGEDGCVRLWNPLVSGDDHDNGISIAEVNSDISYFSLGDRFAGEHQLVVGDCAGEVTIFDNIII